MILKETLRAIVKSQREELLQFDIGVKRDELANIDINAPLAIIISGIRRCGKSTLMRQLIKELSKTSRFYYFNFEDTRIKDFEVSDFDKLNEIFVEEYGEAKHYFFDEVQNAERWELFVRKMLDRKKHFVITGSNASLLSKELGTRLTGRHLTYELFPFSFREFHRFFKHAPSEKLFYDYFLKGGFPEYLKTDKGEVLQELFKDITARDIAVRHKIRNLKELKELGVYLLTNNSLAKVFGLSTNTVIEFISYFEDSYLLFTIPRFYHSLKKQRVNPKKVYAIDNGLIKANTASFSEDSGRLLENLVFLNLRKNHKEIFYFKETGECDFVVKKGVNIISAIQVCHTLNDDNKSRELSGLLEALKKFDLKTGLILTYKQEDTIEIGSKKVLVMPVWKWLNNKNSPLGSIPKLKCGVR